MNQLWAADLTYVAIPDGFVCLAAILDAWSRKVVGYATSRSVDARIAIAAPKAALRSRLPADRPCSAMPFLQRDGIRSSFGRRFASPGDHPMFSEPLRIAIIGAGKIGSTFAFQLAGQGRHDVTVVARPGSARLAQLQRDGAIVRADGERSAVRVLDRLDAQTPYDLVVVTLLAHQVEAVLPDLQRSAAPCVQFMFNTFDPERLQQAMGGPERCAFGMPFVQAMLDVDGRLEATIGAAGRKTLMSRQRWVDVFNAAGVPSALEPEMLLWLRCHAPLCVAFESVSLAGERRGGGALWSEALVLARGVQAGFDLIEALGFTVYPSGKKLMHRAPAAGLATMLWSMSKVAPFRKLLATGQAECRALVEVMAAAAAGGPPERLAKIVAMKP